MESSSTTPPWLELPREITAAILHKLGAIEMLATAQNVCKAWRSVCQDASMWRCIDMHNLGDLWDMSYNLEKMCIDAVDRSQGQLIDINIEYFGTDELLHYISQRCSQQKRLQIVFCYDITSEGLIETTKIFPLLEEMHLYYPKIDTEVIKAIGQSCPQLKSFTLNNQWYKYQDMDLDMEAQAIAKTMPQLCHLKVFGNTMTNEGLQAILDSCPHLESLDLRQCFNIRFGGKIAQLCTQRIKDLRRPHDSTHGYPFQCDVKDHETSGEDNITGFSDVETESDYADYLEFSGGSDYSHYYENYYYDPFMGD